MNLTMVGAEFCAGSSEKLRNEFCRCAKDVKKSSGTKLAEVGVRQRISAEMDQKLILLSTSN